MKRYELARKEGLNWQAVIVQDLETDVKIYVLNAVRNGENWGKVNATVTRMINEGLKDVESDEVRGMAKTSLYLYASKVYVQAFSIYGTREDGAELLLLLRNKGYTPPQEVTTAISSLPPKSASKGQFQSPKGTNLTLPQAYNRAVANGINPTEYEKEVIRRTNRLLDTVAKVDYSEYTSLRASVERQLRWENNEGKLKDLRANGVKFVWIDSHANCSPRCQPYQGRLYSLDHTVGEIDGVKYVPLENATDVYETTKAGKTYKNGCISGFNCRHKTVPYRKGFRPQTIPESVTKKQYAIDRKMRELERKVRFYESRALGYKDSIPKLYKINKFERNQAYKEYVDFAMKNGVAFYPSRVDI